ncbi:MAG TPA: bifunctional DNA-formamidopyrimidine glycosylase/DNA-(apurinic or apyrimidinic site) lyase [Dehalococcoidia bacterium]|nr:bifunctional DNA-formamidopyrimidine glycosylase/DNA-(apurinic or apyrimidinic site) lyase [Dehalococcoidia bacterium]
MPELPEVETIRRDLEPRLVGRRITRVEIAPDRVPVLEGIDEASFREGVAGARIEGLDRRGKFLIFELDTGSRLVVHLRMTGKLLLDNAPLAGHLRATFTLDDGSTLRFTDLRKFGRLWLVGSLTPLLDKIGPEPLSEGFALEHLAAALLNRKAPVKSVLLDQRRIAGIGNIYADEALFEAGILPARQGGGLSGEEVARLHAAIRTVLLRGVESRGASFRDYLDASGESGSMQMYVKVFRRTGKPCYVCGAGIERTRVGGRSTHFCPVCQR